MSQHLQVTRSIASLFNQADAILHIEVIEMLQYCTTQLENICWAIINRTKILQLSSDVENFFRQKLHIYFGKLNAEIKSVRLMDVFQLEPEVKVIVYL